MIKTDKDKKEEKLKTKKPGTIPWLDVEEVEDIDEIVSRLAPETWKSHFIIMVRKHIMVSGSNKKSLWSLLANIESDELDGILLSDLLIEKYEPGTFRVQFLTINKEPIKGVPFSYKITLGDIGKQPEQRPANTGRQIQGQNRGNQDPVNDNADLIRQKAELEIQKIQAAKKKLDMETKMMEYELDQKMKMMTGSNKDDGEIKLLKQQIQHNQENMQRMIESLAKDNEKKSSGNGELTELKALIVAQNAKIEAMGKEKEQHGWMEMFIKMQSESTARFETLIREQNNLIKSKLENQGDRTGLRDGIKTLRELTELSEFVKPRQEVELIEPRPTTSVWDKIGEGFVRMWDMLEAKGKFGPVSKNPDEIVLTPEQKEKIVAEMEPEITAIVEARVKAEMQRNAEDKNPEPTADDEHTKINETFKMILSEIDTRPVPRKWVEYARNNLPKSMLDEIRDANEPVIMLKVIEKYSVQYVDKEVISDLQVKLNETANQEWFFVGMNELKVSLSTTHE